ncbi:MAG: pro-sigmaK processing inhibitor BofA family protein [Symbiobacteriia bacterium]
MLWTTLLAYAFGLLFIYALARILYTPLRWALTLVINGLVGGVALWTINWAAGWVGFSLPLNPVTALIVGLLGLPGLVLVILLKFWVYG